MRGYFGPLVATSATASQKEARRAEQTRRTIRQIATELPEDEATAITDTLDRIEEEIRHKEEVKVQYSFTWSKFPPEIRNMIYSLIFVQDEPISAKVSYPGQKFRQTFDNKYDLGASFLCTGKEVYKEALPMLLGRNTFEVNAHLHYLLGNDRLARSNRGKLIKKIAIDPHLSASEKTNLRKLNNLQECLIVGRRAWYQSRPGQVANLTEAKLEESAFAKFESSSCYRLRGYIGNNPGVKFYYLHEERIKTRNDGSDVAAIRLRVWYIATDSTTSGVLTHEKVATSYYKDSISRHLPLVKILITRDYPSLQPEPSVILPHKEEALIQAIRDAVRALIVELPTAEGNPHIALLDATEAEIRRKRKADVEASSFDWNRVPNEIKNMIYRYLMVQEEPIQPFVAHAGDKQRRSPRKFDLGGNLLTVSKSVYQQALQILLGANTFEVNGHLNAFLGTSKKWRTERAKLIRKVVIHAKPTDAERRTISKLRALEECTVVSKAKVSKDSHIWPYWKKVDLEDSTENLERHAFDEFKSFDMFRLGGVSPGVRLLLRQHPDARFHYLHEFRAKEKEPGDFNVLAVRLRVFLNDTTADGPYRYEGGFPITRYYEDSPRSRPLV